MPIDTTVTPDMLRCIMDAKLIIQGERRENNVVRLAAQTIDCSIFGGGRADMMEGADSNTTDRVWNVLVIRQDWLDHRIPQVGDSIQVQGYPAMKVTDVIADNSVIDMSCRSGAL
jgi:hypothetical protein